MNTAKSRGSALDDVAVEKILDRMVRKIADLYAAETSIREDLYELRPPGDCDWSTHASLQRRVRSACDRPRSCKNLKGCGILGQRGKMNVECARARKHINAVCYRGGNAEHRAEARRAALAANRCRELYRGRKCSGRDFFD